MKIIPKKELREISYGRYNSQPVTEVKSLFNLGDKDLIFPGGESFNQMKKRVITFVRRLRCRKPVLIVTYHGCLKAIAEEFNKKIKKNNLSLK